MVYENNCRNGNKKLSKNLHRMKTCITFAIAKANKANAKAQMAELVDALVSNTSGVTSMPVRSRLWVQNKRLSIELSIT